MITIEKYNEVILESFAFNINDITILIGFYSIDIGFKVEQRFFFYNVEIYQKNEHLIGEHIRMTKPLFDPNHLSSIDSTIKSLSTLSINSLDVYINFLPGVNLNIIAEERYDLTYQFTIENNYSNENYQKKIIISKENLLFISLLPIAEKINDYCRSLINTIAV